ncbi:HAMP domain-containing histidine kinase [Candidatus Saccharibacteria bacterium]|nr:HAMP domain-containing histidine kinase [Candidatus Saccharibacteria bacterium]
MNSLTTPLILVIVALVVGTISFVIGLIVSRQSSSAQTESAESIKDATTRFLITLSSDAVVITDHKYNIVNYNSIFRSLIGTSIILDEQPLSDLLRIVTEEGKDLGVSDIAQFKQGDSSQRRSVFMLATNQQKIEIDVSVYRFQHAGATHLVWKLVNMSTQQNLAKEQSDFISVISHELRTPVAVMEASTSSLLNSANEALSANQRKLVSATRENALLLSKLLADLSVYSTVNSGSVKTEMSSVSPRMILDQMQKVFTSQAEAKNIVLVADHDQNVRSVISSEAHILSIMQNYIKNAIQFSSPGGVVIIATKATADGVVFMVRDSGKGISSEQQQQLFKTTFHAHDDTAHQTLQGVGVGLYISAQLSQAIGATVWAESEVDKGTSLYLKVPVTHETTESQKTVRSLEMNKFAQDI